MPNVTLPGTGSSRLNRSTKLYSNFLRDIAAVVSGSGSPDEVQAPLAFDLALDWLLEHTWEYFHLYGADVTTVAGTADYTIDTRTRDVHNVRVVSANERPIIYMRGDKWDRRQFSQSTNGVFLFYTLEHFHSQSEIRFMPTPDAAETVQMDIYRDPARPSTPSDIIDIANWMERPLILQAQALVTLWRGGQRSIARDLFQLAQDAKMGALARDHEVYDEDVGLDASVEDMRRWPVDHPLYREVDY